MPITAEVLAKRLHTFVMDGPKVWDFAVGTVPRAMLALLAEHGLEASDLDLVILHQSNLRMIEAIMKMRSGCPWSGPSRPSSPTATRRPPASR